LGQARPATAAAERLIALGFGGERERAKGRIHVSPPLFPRAGEPHLNAEHGGAIPQTSTRTSRRALASGRGGARGTARVCLGRGERPGEESAHTLSHTRARSACSFLLRGGVVVQRGGGRGRAARDRSFCLVGRDEWEGSGAGAKQEQAQKGRRERRELSLTGQSLFRQGDRPSDGARRRAPVRPRRAPVETPRRRVQLSCLRHASAL
jgi:hypothetical protein